MDNQLLPPLKIYDVLEDKSYSKIIDCLGVLGDGEVMIYIGLWVFFLFYRNKVVVVNGDSIKKNYEICSEMMKFMIE